MNRKIIEQVFGKKPLDLIDKNVCPTCGNPIDDFRDELSKKEYEISGMCQQCQDEVFL